MNKKQSELEEARATLIDRFGVKPGDTIFTVLRSVSRSGMSREIGVLVPTDDGKDFFHPNYAVATLTGSKTNKSGDGVKVSGCGMDMGFHLVYSLSYALFPKGFDCIGEKCPANDHANAAYHPAPAGTCEDHVKQTHGVCKNSWCVPWHHSDGGYALRQRWI